MSLRRRDRALPARRRRSGEHLLRHERARARLPPDRLAAWRFSRPRTPGSCSPSTPRSRSRASWPAPERPTRPGHLHGAPMLGLDHEPRPDHAADALAAALTPRSSSRPPGTRGGERYDRVPHRPGRRARLPRSRCSRSAASGYRLRMSTRSLAALPAEGDEVTVLTHLHVREDELSLYGFESLAEQEAFELLLTVSGVGPKVALAMLSIPVDRDPGQAVATQDVGAASRAFRASARRPRRGSSSNCRQARLPSRRSGPRGPRDGAPSAEALRRCWPWASRRPSRPLRSAVGPDDAQSFSGTLKRWAPR